ncbi:MAG: hypothetical protein H6978_12675 [Gammaproteobacteria bacterium]|nr:hypothetical protein [Gammaproteobacteria bacterium]
MSWLRKVDHISYACDKGNIEKWAWFHIEVEGGTLIKRIDDVRPDDPHSSMKIWCIDYGDFGVALIEGIDRAGKSQVTRFVEVHGDHACQHVAYDCNNLDDFQAHFMRMGGAPRGRPVIRDDGFGILKQIFAKGYSEGDPAATTFPEYCQRPRGADLDSDVNITFSNEAGKTFYDQIEQARDEGDERPFFDFSAMPADWKVPPEQQRGR